MKGPPFAGQADQQLAEAGGGGGVGLALRGCLLGTAFLGVGPASMPLRKTKMSDMRTAIILLQRGHCICCGVANEKCTWYGKSEMVYTGTVAEYPCRSWVGGHSQGCV